jgi:hypothetical protein
MATATSIDQQCFAATDSKLPLCTNVSVPADVHVRVLYRWKLTGYHYT